MKDICIITVTYGDRFPFLKKVLDRVLNENVKKIIVVDNNSSKDSKEKLKEYIKNKEEKIKILSLEENLGSAGGFKKGLEIAKNCKECDFILLLDDDNLPEKGIFDKIFNKIENLDFSFNKDALWMYRTDRENFIAYIKKNNPSGMLPDKNGFLGMHFITIFGKIIELLKAKIFKNKPLEINKNYGFIYAAPYGGLFFHKSLLDKIGFPREEFFVYVDDYEWTYRIKKNGGKIVALLDLKIEDIDKSWHIKRKGKSFFSKILNTDDYKRVYYTIRNRIVFEQENFVKNRFIYNINKFLFLLALRLYKNKNNEKQYKIVLKAIEDGYKRRLGRVL
ncbi:MAG: glycosyltransferase [Aquificae bacterium]|nr:glycosyltransferase [Aquificota bacterium]